MSDHAVEHAVRRVLPAFHLKPDQFELGRGFVSRAERRSTPTAVALNSMEQQLLFVGRLSSTDPVSAAGDAATAALAALYELAREVCERFIVAWLDDAGTAFAAAFTVRDDRSVGDLLATSWTPPESWPEPMIEAGGSADEAVARALARLRSTVEKSRREDGFEAELERALRLVDLELEYRGGEGQRASEHPDPVVADTAWEAWLERYERSVRDELRRIAGTPPAGSRAGSLQPSRDGALRGMQVFISYARPDATTLAHPVHKALSSLGATVWFDQEQQPDPEFLDSGLRDAIGACDAYIMCASDEFVERAGYATQEMAWAVEHSRGGGRTRKFLVVARPNTVLPSVVADWPMIELLDHREEELAASLAHELTAPATHEPAPITAARVPSEPTPLVPPPAADLAAMRTRVQHMRLFDAIDEATLSRAAGTDDDARRTLLLRQRLLKLGEGLEWSGTFTDLDSWPPDSFVRDYRFRLAAGRTLAGTRWPLSGNLDEGPDVSNEVEFLATRPPPLLDWAPVVGWAENERRFALRYHAGVLRGLSALLERGLYGALVRTRNATISGWIAELQIRRRECYDALVAQRLEGLVSWRRSQPTWDHLFRSWHELLTAGATEWDEPVPPRVRLLLAGNADMIAAVGATTAWCTAYDAGFALQSLVATTHDNETWSVVVCSGDGDGDASGGVRLALVPGDPCTVSLAWRDGESMRPAPALLRQACNFSSS